MTWRPPLASAGLITIFLAVVLAIEWMARWRTAKKLPRPIFPKKDYNESMDESILQQMIRSKTAKGLDQLNGTFLAEFSANAMTATVHIPFCPAFEHVPNVQVFPTDETDTHLRIASTKPFGIRVDVKRKNLSISRIHFVLIAEG